MDSMLTLQRFYDLLYSVQAKTDNLKPTVSMSVTGVVAGQGVVLTSLSSKTRKCTRP